MVRAPGPTRLVLASASPRRRALLAQVGIVPDAIVPAEIDETPHRGELPGALATRLAAAKADAAVTTEKHSYLIAADTVVGIGRRVLGKPEDEASARRYLAMLSGRRHRVYGGVTVVAPDGRKAQRLVVTTVVFKRLEPSEMDAYIATGEWRDKAGGYAIQGAAGAFVPVINGSYFNIVGLPLYETLSLLRGLGFAADRATEDG